MTIYSSAAVAIIGLVVYLVATPPRPSEVGRLAFFAGLLVFLLTFAGKVLHN